MTDKEFAEALGRVIEYARGALPSGSDVLIVATNPARLQAHCGTSEVNKVRAPVVIGDLARSALEAVKAAPQLVTVSKRENLS